MEKEKVLVRLDRHLAHRTDARTWWTIIDSDNKEVDIEKAFKCIFSTRSGGKTHWYEYYLVPRNITLVRNRISNRGNYSRSIYTTEDVKANWDEVPPLRGLYLRWNR